MFVLPVALAEHAADDLRLQPTEDENKQLSPLQGVQIAPATPDQVIPLEPRDSQSLQKLVTKPYSPDNKIKEKKAVDRQDSVKEISFGEKRKEIELELPVDKKIKGENKEDIEDLPAGEKRKKSDQELPAEKKVKEEKNIGKEETYFEENKKGISITIDKVDLTKEKQETTNNKSLEVTVQNIKGKTEEMDSYGSFNSRRSSARRVEGKNYIYIVCV